MRRRWEQSVYCWRIRLGAAGLCMGLEKMEVRPSPRQATKGSLCWNCHVLYCSAVRWPASIATSGKVVASAEMESVDGLAQVYSNGGDC